MDNADRLFFKDGSYLRCNGLPFAVLFHKRIRPHVFSAEVLIFRVRFKGTLAHNDCRIFIETHLQSPRLNSVNCNVVRFVASHVLFFVDDSSVEPYHSEVVRFDLSWE